MYYSTKIKKFIKILNELISLLIIIFIINGFCKVI